MSIFTQITKSLRNYFPASRRPTSVNNSQLSNYISNYGWIFRASNKISGDYGLYHRAETNVYVYRAIQVISDTLLINGYTINNPDELSNDLLAVNYLNGVFNNPSGKNSDITYPILHKQFMTSFELTGDAFLEVNHEEFTHKDEERKIISGLQFIPPELLKWFEDTEQWGYRNKPDIRYENDELIHIYEPNIKLRDSKYGVSKLDKIRLPLIMMFLGLTHNAELLDNDGLDPKAILSFDKDVNDDVFESELARLSALSEERKHGGTLAVKGATFQTSSLSNTDMDFLSLMNLSRDMIITAYGVQPSKVGIRETANLGSGSGDSQDKDFKDMMNAKAKIIEGSINKVLGRNGFQELFQFNEMDKEDKLRRAQIESLQINSGVTSINEVRAGYGYDPVPWGDNPYIMMQDTLNNNPDTDLSKALKNNYIRSGYLDSIYYR